MHIIHISVQIVPLEETSKDATKISVSLILHHLSTSTKQKQYQRNQNDFILNDE